MKYIRLDKLIELKQGMAINSHSNHLISDVETSLPLLRIADMPTKSRIVFMKPETPERFIAKKDDIIYTRTGQVGLVFREQYGVVHNNCFRVYPIDEKTLSRDYLFWCLKLSSTYKWANSIAAGSAQPDLPHSSFKKIKIPFFPFSEQKRIASILSAYDNLIENNNKRIEILEQMAENLYKEWFVRFRFPGHETTPIENGIPHGWKRDCINKFYTTFSGGTPSREKQDFYEDGTIPWVKTGEIVDSIIQKTEEKITEEAVKKSSAKMIPSGSLLMAMYGVNIGKLGITSIEMTCNQAACVFKDLGAKSSAHYLFHYLKSIREYLLSISFGAAQQNLSQELIKKIKVVMPSKTILEKFEDFVSSYYDEISALQNQNDNLIKQRDLLLPRLMSGKLTV